MKATNRRLAILEGHSEGRYTMSGESIILLRKRSLMLVTVFLIFILTLAVQNMSLRAIADEDSLLFEDDFEDGVISNDWNIVDDEQTGTATVSLESGALDETGDQLLQIEVRDDGTDRDDRGQVLLSIPESLGWEDYAFEVDARIDEIIRPAGEKWGYIDFFFCSQSTTDISNTYWLRLSAYQDLVDLRKTSQDQSSSISISSATFVIDEEKTYHVEIMVLEGNIQIYVESQLVIDVNEDSFTLGTIGLGASNAGCELLVRAHFDNVEVHSIAQLPSSSPGPIQPAPPQNLLATPGDGFIFLTWKAPFEDGGDPIINYTIYRGLRSGGEEFLDVVGNVLYYFDDSVVNNQTYYYRGSALNSVGESYHSNEAFVTPYGGASPRDSDGDGLVDSWEETYFGGLEEGLHDDYDGDGYTNFQEYQAGTNPTDKEDPYISSDQPGIIATVMVGILGILGGFIPARYYYNKRP